MLTYRPSLLEDCKHLSWKIRPADRREVLDVAGITPLQAFEEGFRASLRPLTVVNVHPVAMVGAVPLEGSEGVVWMLGTPGIETNKVSFIRQCRKVMDEVCDPFNVVYNCIDKRNTVHLRWLQWLGFSIINEIEEFGVNGITVYEFARIC